MTWEETLSRDELIWLVDHRGRLARAAQNNERRLGDSLNELLEAVEAVKVDETKIQPLGSLVPLMQTASRIRSSLAASRCAP